VIANRLNWCHPFKPLPRILLATLVIALTSLRAADDLTPPPLDFDRQVRPILSQHCTRCHGASLQEGKLRLDSPAAILRGGEDGTVVVPHEPQRSKLLDRVRSTGEDRMPPVEAGARLTDADAATLEQWILRGASGNSKTHEDQDAENFWSYKSPTRPPLPKDSAHHANPIDAFLAAARQSVGVTLLAPASPRTLLRRVYYDLIGLPPSEEELVRFENDPSDAAYAKIVDELLARKEYGQRWARHWMDIWRYSDWYGHREMKLHHGSRRHIWRWRDWIVDAFNSDLGYDQMIQDMLAADETTSVDEHRERATGYLGRNYYAFSRSVWLHDTVDHVGMGIMAVTLRCARCHDHKYEPISQEEYFRLRAFFEPMQIRTDRVPGAAEQIDDVEPVYKKARKVLRDGFDRVYEDGEPPTYVFRAGNEKDPITDRSVRPGVPAILSSGSELGPIVPISLGFQKTHPHLRPFVVAEEEAIANQHVEEAQRELKSSREAWRRAAEHLAADQAPSSRQALDVAERKLRIAELTLSWELARGASHRATIAADLARVNASASLAASSLRLEEVHRLQTLARLGEWRLHLELTRYALEGTTLPTPSHSPVPTEWKTLSLEERAKRLTDEVAKLEAIVRSPQPNYESFGQSLQASSSGRRTALAKWLTDSRHPRTSRVAVNHVWLRHFGKPLVANVYDFGTTQPTPTHPELLDWLAVEFAENGWSMKHLHRLMVLSRTYRASSKPSPAEAALATHNESIDSDNVNLWRWNPRRIEAEAVRDSLLLLAGELDTSLGGPDIDPALEDASPRRSLYLRHTAFDRSVLLSLFDSANPDECYRRPETITPQQAWALMGSKLAFRAADRLTMSCAESMDDSACVTILYRQALGREPTASERSRCLEFIRQSIDRRTGWSTVNRPPTGALESTPDDPIVRRAAWAELAHVLLNHHDFVMIH
jgi:hypothetical protein